MRIPLFEKLSTHNLKAVSVFLFPLFFVVLADSILSFNFPIVVENTVNSNLLAGIIMGLSALVGVICDLIFPIILKSKTWKFQLGAAIAFALTLPIAIYFGQEFGIFFLFILASILWGIYFELLNFAQQNFVVTEESKQNFTRYWGVIFVVVEITGILGPIMGSLLLQQANITANGIILFIQSLALVFALLVLWHFPYKTKVEHKSKIKEALKVIKEIKYWGIFSQRLLPVIIMGITLEFIEATFWTLGGLFGQSLSGDEALDFIPILLYTFPFIVGALILAKLNVSHHKKRVSQLTLLGGAISLIPIFLVTNNLLLIFALIFISSSFLSFAGPLNEAVFSDLVDRSENRAQSLIGLTKATSSIAYTIAPILMGYLADVHGYYFVFSSLGFASVIIAIILLVITPRKLRIPHQELEAIK